MITPDTITVKSRNEVFTCIVSKLSAVSFSRKDYKLEVYFDGCCKILYFENDEDRQLAVKHLNDVMTHPGPSIHIHQCSG